MLLSVSEVMESMGLAPVLEAQLEGPLTKAINKAQLRLEAELDTRLDEADNIETFHLNLDLLSGITPNGMIAMRLNNAFVKASPAIALTYATKWNDTYETVPTTDYHLNVEKGQVYIDTLYEAKYVRVTYRSGFKKASEVSGALKEALTLMVPSQLAAQTEGEALVSKDASGLTSAGTIITHLKRPMGLGFKPFLVSSTPT